MSLKLENNDVCCADFVKNMTDTFINLQEKKLHSNSTLCKAVYYGMFVTVFLNFSENSCLSTVYFNYTLFAVAFIASLEQ